LYALLKSYQRNLLRTRAPHPACAIAQLIDLAVRRLIVNADDFGLTRGVNRAIIELHRASLLTSATLMANAPAASDAVRIALETPSLGVGCHVVLIDGAPILPADRLSSLASQRTGRFHSTLGSFLRSLLTGRIRPADIELEASAQISNLQSRGMRLTHVDTHKHTHMFPAILRPLLRAAKTNGIRTVRNPFEPAWSRRATPVAPVIRRAEVALLNLLQPAFHRIVAQHGFTTTDGALGVLATGTLNEITLRSLLPRIPDGTWELVTHPGYNDDDLAGTNTRLTGSRHTEFQSLRALKEVSGLELVNFSSLLGI
jgi:predicted glycoside hydrolase/deacetylase ChbG (UPF0249 family)